MIHVGGLLESIIGLVLVLVGIVIVFKVGGAVLPLVLFSVGDIVNAFKTGSVNDSTGDAVLNVSGIIVAVVAVLGLLTLFIRTAFEGINAGNRGGGGY